MNDCCLTTTTTTTHKHTHIHIYIYIYIYICRNICQDERIKTGTVNVDIFLQRKSSSESSLFFHLYTFSHTHTHTRIHKYIYIMYERCLLAFVPGGLRDEIKGLILGGLPQGRTCPLAQKKSGLDSLPSILGNTEEECRRNCGALHIKMTLCNILSTEGGKQIVYNILLLVANFSNWS